jgi:hypothetical protein
MKYPKRSQYKYVKSRNRVQNWAQYEAGLRNRCALPVWLSDAALSAWFAPASGRHGGQRTYSDLPSRLPLRSAWSSDPLSDRHSLVASNTAVSGRRPRQGWA